MERLNSIQIEFVGVEPAVFEREPPPGRPRGDGVERLIEMVNALPSGERLVLRMKSVRERNSVMRSVYRYNITGNIDREGFRIRCQMIDRDGPCLGIVWYPGKVKRGEREEVELDSSGTAVGVYKSRKPVKMRKKPRKPVDKGFLPLIVDEVIEVEPPIYRKPEDQPSVESLMTGNGLLSLDDFLR